MEIKNKTLEQLCPFIKPCAENNYRDVEICKNGAKIRPWAYCFYDYETCKNYSFFKEREMKTIGNVVIEKLPTGICNGAIETWPERYIPSRMIYASYLIGGGKKLGNRLKKGIPRGLKLL